MSEGGEAAEIDAGGLAAAEQLWRDYDRRGGYAPSVRMLIERYVERSSGSAAQNHEESRCPECGNAAVGWSPPYRVNHEPGCPRSPQGEDHEGHGANERLAVAQAMARSSVAAHEFPQGEDHEARPECVVWIIPGDHRPTSADAARADVILKLNPPSARVGLLGGEAHLVRWPNVPPARSPQGEDHEAMCPGCGCRNCVCAYLPNRPSPVSGTEGRVREIARDCGYAIAAHGSRRRDLDLIAVPWIDDAVGNAELVDALVEHFPFVLKEKCGKPHGRVGYVLCGAPGVEYVDLSVTPRPVPVSGTEPKWSDRVSAIVDEAHAENLGGDHRDGFCRACAAAYLVAQRAVPGSPVSGTEPDTEKESLQEWKDAWTTQGKIHAAEVERLKADTARLVEAVGLLRECMMSVGYAQRGRIGRFLSGFSGSQEPQGGLDAMNDASKEKQ